MFCALFSLCSTVQSRGPSSLGYSVVVNDVWWWAFHGTILLPHQSKRALTGDANYEWHYWWAHLGFHSCCPCQIHPTILLHCPHLGWLWSRFLRVCPVSASWLNHPQHHWVHLDVQRQRTSWDLMLMGICGKNNCYMFVKTDTQWHYLIWREGHFATKKLDQRIFLWRSKHDNSLSTTIALT